MDTLNFGLIGLGLMGKEFAGCVGRWFHLQDAPLRPELVAICDADAAQFPWYANHFPTISQQTTDYHELLQNPAVEAVYCAVPHHLHEEIYCAVLRAGKHLMGEKPFGIDRHANEGINKTIRQNPDCFVRSASQFPFFPAMQRLSAMIEEARFGKIIEVNCGFKHSSDLDSGQAHQLETDD